MSTYTPASSSPHAFCPANAGDSRSPCPALNALANHSYLPHDGRNLTVKQLVEALKRVYNVSAPLAYILSLGGVLSCGNGLKVDLEQLARHNRIEHDASLAHANVRPGQLYAPTNVDPALLADFLGDVPTSTESELATIPPQPTPVTFAELVSVRVRRDASLIRPLDSFHAEISRGELSLVLGEFGDEKGEVSREQLRVWFGEERLPEAEGWCRPVHTVGLLNTVKRSRKIASAVEKMSKDKSV